ncbi:MAG: hypothetical protein HKN20_04280 [Gemmatimonadetes bacterium]|nr:hypothetical protein [Gemmatimonadota bacterium]
MRKNRKRSIGSTFPMILLGGAVMIACVSQRFSVDQIVCENQGLARDLVERMEERDRIQGTVQLLSRRDRIEEYAVAELGMRTPHQREQLYLPEWEAAPAPESHLASLVASVASRWRSED